MGLRDIVLLISIYGSLPFILLNPFIGVLVWNWLGLMNPHRISWVLTNQPFAQLVAVVLLGSLAARYHKLPRFPWTPITITLTIFTLWLLFTTFFAFYPGLAWKHWDKVWKIMLTTYIAIWLLTSIPRINAVVTVAALSIGFYGFKGGLFTITTGGNHKVLGPAGSFIGDNNGLGLALIMTVPLLFYLREITTYRLFRLLLLAGVVLCAFAILGTWSRGALVGISAMAIFLALKSARKFQYLLLIAVLAPVAYNFMPEGWHERMGTIKTYEQDASAMGRIKAWHMAFNLASQRLTGGGFETFKPAVYLMYLPEVGPRTTDAHSVYFELLGETGFIGLGLFLLLTLLLFRTCGTIIKATRGDPELAPLGKLAAMIQVSLIGYAVSGLFLGLAYFNYYYALLTLVVGMSVVVKAKAAAAPAALVAPAGTARASARPAHPRPGRGQRAPPPRGATLRFAPSPARLWADVLGWYRRL